MHQALGDVVPASWPLANPVLRLSALGCGLSPLCVPGCFSFMPSELLSTALPFYPLLAWNSHLLHLEKYLYSFRTWLRWILKGDVSFSLSMSSFEKPGSRPRDAVHVHILVGVPRKKEQRSVAEGWGREGEQTRMHYCHGSHLGSIFLGNVRRQRRRHIGSLWSGAEAPGPPQLSVIGLPLGK